MMKRLEKKPELKIFAGLISYLIIQAILNVPLYFLILKPIFPHISNEWEIYHIILSGSPVGMVVLFSMITLVVQFFSSTLVFRRFSKSNQRDPNAFHWLGSYFVYFCVMGSQFLVIGLFIPEVQGNLEWLWLWLMLGSLSCLIILAFLSFIGLMLFAFPTFLTIFTNNIIISPEKTGNLLGIEKVFVGDYIPAGGIWVMIRVSVLFSPILLLFPVALFKISQRFIENISTGKKKERKSLCSYMRGNKGIFGYKSITTGYWTVLPTLLMLFYVEEHSTVETIGGSIFLIIISCLWVLLFLILPFFLCLTKR